MARRQSVWISHARVDLIRIDAAFHLMELELIEPALFLDAAPGAVDRLCAAVIARLRRDGASGAE